MRPRVAPARVGLYVLMLLLAVPLVFPMWWMVSSSFKAAADIFAYPPELLPRSVHPENYVEVFEFAPFAIQYWNSVYIGVANTVGTVLISSLAGYAFARIKFPGRSILFV